ncbi:hypothetical protein [Nocardia sputi]|uniref:hypothetical protein n=1 Tax=Nocardia sputi TaxID=2943705 RepID=UPI0020BEE8D0|nr:hypothetical protein [Nocardia sputi]
MHADRPRSSKIRRSPEALDRIQRSQERVKARRDAARLQEQIILEAVKRYIDAWQAIRVREAKRDSDIEQLRLRITEVEADAAAEIDRHRITQAGIAATLREQRQTADDIAELLEITPKEARRLLGLAHNATEPTTTQPAAPPRLQSAGQKQGNPSPVSPVPEPARDIGGEPDGAEHSSHDRTNTVAGKE